MSLLDCKHRPPCPTGSSRWKCGQRTNIESAVCRGLITQEAGRSLLTRYGCPMTPMSKVYTGNKDDNQPVQRKLV